MLNVQSFCFNPFQENTYIVDNGSLAMIIDPGCYTGSEEKQLEEHLINNGLELVYCINTHAHLDHIFGNAWVFSRFGLKPMLHEADLFLLQGAPNTARMYGLTFNDSPEPETYLSASDRIELGDDELMVLCVPGHAPGHIAIYSKTQGFVVAGDVLFQRSIGRVDLPGGDLDTLLGSIRTQLFVLPDETIVYCGHGPSTTIGEEKRENPFLI